VKKTVSLKNGTRKTDLLKNGLRKTVQKTAFETDAYSYLIRIYSYLS